ncbi:lytic transglycosylase (plasmid) [Paracoccus tegillarcae]|uniref:Lytic transglycosylase n=2 Tax=Paracoccus tegillarcae TaxID=1529068 RepID=A0A2K9EKQ1_9RHOB|nr:lytic transglycosylase [Paracoccus tegillarcae]
MFLRRSDRTGRRTTCLLMAASVTAAPLAVLAQGVPDIDAKGILAIILQLDTGHETRTAEIEETARQTELLAREKEQLAALDGTLELLTGTSAFIPGLEEGGGAGSAYAASTVYAIDDNNPYVDRIMGDAPVTIEQMIAETAIKFGGHPALGRAGINAVEFRCWFQALVKQESNFSIGAKSPKAAFGLTQIIPGTAQYLGIYPAYYDDPRLQLDGGARYLLEQLGKFGSMELALAAYNAGPGAVQKYNGVPPYKETQDYVRKISGYYSRYAARMGGAADAIGTLDPKDLAIAEASNLSDAGTHYAAWSMDTMTASATRLRSIVSQIEGTQSVKEAMDLNTYARGEVARMGNILIRLMATRQKIEAARNALLIQAYIEDEKYLQVRLQP